MNTERMQQQIAERDELVQELTRQLEQAAEQLDRMQRSGGLSARPVAAAISAEVVRQQETMGEDLAYLVNQWETSQLPGAVGRIELQLDELRDLITKAMAEAAARPALPPVGSIPAPPPAAHLPRKSHPEDDLLASLQEALNRDDEYPDEQAYHDPRHDPRQTHAAGHYQSPYGDLENYQLPELPTPPLPVDFEEADPSLLQDAIIERDQYIRMFLEEFRRLHQSASLQMPTDWDELKQAPDALRMRLQKLERQLQEQLRLGEVSLSIERARLSRESTNLELARIQLQKQLKKQGIDPQSINGIDPIIDERPPATGDKQRTQKWLNMLRIKDNDR